MTKVFKCPKCGKYTLELVCKTCKIETRRADPPKYKINDKYAKLREKTIYG